MTTRRNLLAGTIALAAAPAFAAMPDGHARAFAVARACQRRLEPLLRAQGLARGTVAERLRALAKDERWLYPDDEAGRDRAVAEMNARLAALRPHLPRAFGDLSIPPAEVRRMSASDVAAGKGGYREIGAYYLDLRNIRGRPSWTLPSVAFHEVTPGHLLQLPLQAPGASSPPGFFEGWAIYAEQLACDLGAYARDPLGEIGYLQWRLFRLGRVIADTGMAARGWSQDQAIATMRELQGFDIAFVSIAADIARMAKEPGRFAADGLYALDLAARRPRDVRRWPAFHRQVLGLAKIS